VLTAELELLRPRLLPEVAAWRAEHPDGAATLFGSAGAGLVLGFLSLHLDEPCTMSELELRTGMSYDSVHRAVRRLEQSGLIAVDAGPRTLSVSMPRSPLAMPVRCLTLAEGPIASALRWLRSVHGDGAVSEAFVFGSVARGDETASSDLDAFVVTDLPQVEVSRALRGLSDMLRREIVSVVRTPAHVAARRAAGYGFYRSVYDGPRIPLAPRMHAVDEHSAAALAGA